MWIFRIIYSLIIFGAFVFFRGQLDIDINHAVSYALGIVLAINLVELLVKDLKSFKIIVGFVGGLVFLLISYFISKVFDTVFSNEAIKLAFYFIFVYLGVLVGYKNFSLIESFFSKKQKRYSKTKYIIISKVIDTSTLIDGRIADIIDTGFIEGKIVIPTFVLKELQNIADSHDHLRRQKGRRGLDILKRIQEQKIVPVEISEEDFTNLGTVDEKLVFLAKQLEAKVITTDFNLLKVAEIQNVKTLNINQLAMALRQNVLPGDSLKITIQKEGKEYSQGVGYLDDGTMVVVENGRQLIGNTVDVLVTSLLQTESGRIIFTKLK
jgi:uncharacterized protein YacL